MTSTRVTRAVFRYSLFLVVAGVLAALLVAADERADVVSPMPVIREATEPASSATTTTTTAPSVFPPLERTDEVRAVRTPSGFVLPVMAGGPGAWEVLTPCAYSTVVDGEPVRRAHVVLDAGHGGSEPGAVGPTGLTEREVNLDIARRTKAALEAEGAVVVLTRPEDVRMTLETRAAIVNAVQPLVFVSIHHNAAPLGVGPEPAPEFYHQLADPESKRLAGLLWEELWPTLASFGSEWAVGDGPGARARQSVRSGDDFYGVLRRTQGVPAVLSEPMYLSDPDEEALLRDPTFRQAEADAITRAIVRFVSTPDPGSGFAATKVSDASAGGGGGQSGCRDPALS